MLEQQLSFIRELDKLKAVYRKALVKDDNNRYENSAEHSWHIALMAQVLKPYAQGEVDISRVTMMLLLHDIVEIDAGDTFAFDKPENLDAQLQKELDAMERIFGLLPPDQYADYKALWLEFEQAETADGQFAKAMDRILPLIQNTTNNGGSWAANKVRKQQVLQRNIYLKTAAPALWDYACQQIELAVTKGWLLDE